MKGSFENGFPFVMLFRLELRGNSEVVVMGLLTVVGAPVGLKCLVWVISLKSSLCASHCRSCPLGVVFGVLVVE